METMEDDIDIEEHDLLDNPRIRDIFPDLGIVKEEPQELYSDQDSYADHEHFGNALLYEESEHADDVAPTYDLNADALPYGSQSPESAQNYSQAYATQSHVIILGTKPSSESLPKERLPVSVPLVDWAEVLSRSPCFCSDCGTLFPTENALDAHKMSSHSFLVAINNNVAKKSTSALSEKGRGELCDVRTNKCNHCDTYFADGTALIKHLYELLPSKNAAVGPPAGDPRAPAEKPLWTGPRKCFKCDLCNEILQSKVQAKRHRDSKHPNMQRRKIFQIIYRKHSNHVGKAERSPAKAPGESAGDKRSPQTQVFKYKCTSCHMWLDSSYLARTHRAYRHPEKYGQFLFKKYVCKNKTNPKTSKSVINNKVSAAKSKAIVAATKVAAPAATKVADSGEFLYRFSRGVPIRNPPIQHALLYRCLQCAVHFVVGYSIINHLKQCRRTTPHETCATCRRKVYRKDVEMHRHQHAFADKFRIYTNIDWNFYKKIMCLCPKCNIYFSEYRFWTHYTEHPAEVESRTCEECHIEINKSCYSFHKNYHRLYNLKRKDIVLVEFRKYEDIGTKRKSSYPALANKKIKLESSSERDETSLRLFYCSTCRCCSHRLMNNDIHFSRSCRNRPRHRCDICGLCFLNKGLRTHKRWHSQYKLSLNNIKFQSHNGDPVVPEPPRFEQCGKCGLHHLRTGHSCKERGHFCRDCRARFTAGAYKLHRPFHELKTKHDSKELHKMWNMVYHCEVCEFGFDSYDHAVAHSQQHLLREDTEQLCERCEVCDLKLHLDCMDRHRRLHENRTLNKSDFLILNFDYKNLLHDKWLQLFGRLPQAAVREVVRRSLHGSHRGVKLRLKEDGPAEYTIYFCNGCEICIDDANVSRHAHKSCRKNERKYHCSRCALHFDNSENYARHERDHGATDRFRIVEFKYETDAREHGEEVPERDKLTFYSCGNCKVAMRFQWSTSKHRCNDEEVVACDQCGLHYYARRAPRHELMHRKFPDLSRDRVVQRPFSNAEKKLVSVIVHKCPCGLHLPSPAAAEQHVRDCALERGPAATCDTCGLLFPVAALPQHRRAHHTAPARIQVENVPVLVLYECEVCRLLLHSRRELAQHECGAGARDCARCGLRLHPSAVETHAAKHETNEYGFFFNNIVKLPLARSTSEKEGRSSAASDAGPVGSSVPGTSPSPVPPALSPAPPTDGPRPGPDGEYKFKLYKCRECDVHFTDEGSCRSHVARHERLGEAEYIGCKLCGLQFLVAQLHGHVRSHHGTPVHLQEVLVEEHCAADRLQSRTVSSTRIEKTVE